MRHQDLSIDLQRIISDAANAAADAVVAKLGFDHRGSPGARLMTVKQAAAFLATSRSTLDRLERAGTLRPKRIGRRVVYERAEIESFLAKSVGSR
jgi:excisionase family DNA binding protein